MVNGEEEAALLLSVLLLLLFLAPLHAHTALS